MLSLVLAASAVALVIGSAPATPEVDEQPGDPPGVPARPRLDADPAPPVVHGGAVTMQANVDGNGANIVGDAANEPSIAYDPTNPNRIAIGWRQFDTITSNFRQAGRAFSADGGRTWTFPGSLDAGVFRSDPVLDFDSGGVFYYSSLRSTFDVDVYTSLDGGVTWLGPVAAFGGDKQWLAVDRTGGPGDGHLYQFWNLFAGCCGSDIFTRSTDDAQSFETPIAMPESPRRGTLDVGPDGTLYLTGMDPFDASSYFVVRSANAQDSTATPTFGSSTVSLGGSLIRPSENFSFPNPNGLNGQVQVDTDHSGSATHGNVYVLCSVDPPGADPADVHLVRSTDGGVSWSAPVKINDDAAGAWQWFGTFAVAPNGRLDAVWNDGRGETQPNMSALYTSSSTDGGVTWSTNEALSPTWNSHLGFPNQNKIGDYYHLVSDDVGAHLAWAATFNGEQDVYYTRIGDYDCNANGVGDAIDISSGTSFDGNANGIPDECEAAGTGVASVALPAAGRAVELLPNEPNPFVTTTTLRLAVEVSIPRARVRIFDAAGRHVAVVFEGSLADGERRVVWDGRGDDGRSVAAGVYWARLEAGPDSATRPILRLR